MSLLLAGWNTAASGVTLDRFCGSGITSVNLAAASIMSGMEDCVVAGGTEMMSYTATQGGGLLDADNMTLRDLHPQWHQGICADLIATLEEDQPGRRRRPRLPKPAARQGGHRRKPLR